MAAGISESAGPHAFIVPGHDRYGIEPWTAAEVPGLLVTPAPEQPVAFAEGDAIEPFALALLEAQRRMRIEQHPGWRPMHIVGGHVELTTVRREGIEQRILKRWPDAIGRVVDPFAGERAEAA